MAKKWMVTIEEKNEYYIEVYGDTVADAINNALNIKENRPEAFELSQFTEFPNKVINIARLDG